MNQKFELTRLASSKFDSNRMALRAQIVLLAAQGLQSEDIGEQLGFGRVQVTRWR
ncbi:helix-turn-helix domain-containing protein [Rhodoferax sp.]|uniref:helix-turn-helix domain-containing protein n=1 Tax=Rhodoferax sp. TaxID=50421 RepID=UPI002601A5CB|nr:helix-turn-helix domain-containing protein [Rhodoferax sp.]MDD2919637.1 helix-turn-helix domain containing protein [Rhodoferax sp.]